MQGIGLSTISIVGFGIEVTQNPPQLGFNQDFGIGIGSSRLGILGFGD